MIVWLASYPRSGNTLFRMLLKHSCGIRTYSIHGDIEFEQFGVADIVGHDRVPGSLEELDRDPEIRFVKTHGLPSDRRPTVYLVRDGRDSVVSYARYRDSFPNGWKARLRKMKRAFGVDTFPETLRAVIESREPFGGWSEHVKAWTTRPGVPLAVVRYEDVVDRPDASLRKAVSDLQLPIDVGSLDQMPSFSELQQLWPQFFRKGRVGSWRSEMPDAMQEKFWQHHGDVMKSLRYER